MDYDDETMLLQAMLRDSEESVDRSLHGIQPGMSSNGINSTDIPLFAAYQRNGQTNNGHTYNTPQKASAKAPSLTPDGNLNIVMCEWGKAKFMVSPCPEATATVTLKARVLQQAIDTVTSAESSFHEKTQFLISHFQQPLVTNLLKTILMPFENVASDPLYTYVFASCHNRSYGICALPTANSTAAQILRFRQNVTYVQFHLTIDPSVTTMAMHSNALPTGETEDILMRVPRYLNPVTNVEELMGPIPHDALRSAQDFMNIMHAGGIKPEVGIFVDGRMDRKAFKDWNVAMRHETAFALCGPFLRKQYVGEGIIERPENRLLRMKQVGPDETGKNRALTVAQFYAAFTAISNELDSSRPYPIKLVDLFFNGLSEAIQKTLQQHQWTAGLTLNNEQQLGELTRLRDLAQSHEASLTANIKMFRASMNSGGRNSNTKSFLAIPAQPDGFDDMSAMTGQTGQPVGLPTGSWTHSPGTVITTPSAATRESRQSVMVNALIAQVCVEIVADRVLDNTQGGVCLLSTAETALRQASGTVVPLECWGCTNHPNFHTNRFHNWRGCPNKRDPTCMERATEQILKWRTELKRRQTTRKRSYYEPTAATTSMYAPAEIVAKWKQLGFANRAQAQTVAMLAATNTTAQKRRKHYQDHEKREGSTDDTDNSPVFMTIPSVRIWEAELFIYPNDWAVEPLSERSAEELQQAEACLQQQWDEYNISQEQAEQGEATSEDDLRAQATRQEILAAIKTTNEAAAQLTIHMVTTNPDGSTLESGGLRLQGAEITPTRVMNNNEVEVDALVTQLQGMIINPQASTRADREGEPATYIHQREVLKIVELLQTLRITEDHFPGHNPFLNQTKDDFVLNLILPGAKFARVLRSVPLAKPATKRAAIKLLARELRALRMGPTVESAANEFIAYGALRRDPLTIIWRELRRGSDPTQNGWWETVSPTIERREAQQKKDHPEEEMTPATTISIKQRVAAKPNQAQYSLALGWHSHWSSMHPIGQWQPTIEVSEDLAKYNGKPMKNVTPAGNSIPRPSQLPEALAAMAARNPITQQPTTAQERIPPDPKTTATENIVWKFFHEETHPTDTAEPPPIVFGLNEASGKEVNVTVEHKTTQQQDSSTKGANNEEADDTSRLPIFIGPATSFAINGHQVTASVLQAPVLQRLPLAISPMLPHVAFPLGRGEHRIKMKMVLDSGAGVNLGHLAFHRALAALYPEIVDQFKTIEEYGPIDLVIGGVDSKSGLRVTHVIVYHTPFRSGGRAATLAFGLSEQAAASAILGMPFLQDAGSLWDFKPPGSVMFSVFNKSMQIEMMPPSRRAIPTIQQRDHQTSRPVLYACPAGAEIRWHSCTDGSCSQRRQQYQEHKSSEEGIQYGPKDAPTQRIETSAFAASSATALEIAAAKERNSAGTKEVVTDKRPYRPKLPSTYTEPEYYPDDDALELLTQDYGNGLYRHRKALPPREPSTIIQYDETKHGDLMRKSLQWDDCPPDLQPQIVAIIKQFWDVFDPAGARHPIRGFTCHIDTGTSKPICCKMPRYGPHESRVINQLNEDLEKNGWVERAESPWGAQVVLAAKPNQEHKHWSEYIWRLCVSYRRLNTVTRPFKYMARRCDDAARDIGPSQFNIAMDFDSGYWQVMLDEVSRAKTAFFVPDGQMQWRVMPMGFINAHAFFCCIVDTLKKEWNALAVERGIRDKLEVTTRGNKPWTGAEVIVDDVMLHSVSKDTLMAYFPIVLEILLKYQVTVKLKKCRFFSTTTEFVGVDIEALGNRPAQSKVQAFTDLKLNIPITVKDLQALIGLIGFYHEWIALFEYRIGRWRKYISKLKPTGTRGEDAKLYGTWGIDDTTLQHQLLDEIIQRPMLKRPDYTRRMYLKTDWSITGMAGVLLQADPDDDEAKAAEEAENAGGPCLFDRALTKLRLRALAYLSKRCNQEAEKHYHSYTGEAATGMWSFNKFRRYLLGSEFTWMTDCDGLKKFFEGEDVITHVHQRWRQQLLRYHFTIVHRPAKFMTECDVLSRYNSSTEEWRQSEPDDIVTALFSNPTRNPASTNVAFANEPLHETGISGQPRALLAIKADIGRTVWTFNAATTTVTAAAGTMGLELDGHLIEDREEWRFDGSNPGQEENGLTRTDIVVANIGEHTSVDWIIGHLAAGDSDQEQQHELDNLRRLVKTGIQHGARAVIVFASRGQRARNVVDILEEHALHCVASRTTASDYGAAIQANFTTIIATRDRDTLQATVMPTEPASAMREHLTQVTRANDFDAVQAIRNTDNNPSTDNGARAHIEVQQQQMGIPLTDRTMGTWTPCFNPDHPGPDPENPQHAWYQSPFAIAIDTDMHDRQIRGIRIEELVSIYGVEDTTAIKLTVIDTDIAMEQIKRTPPKELVAATLYAVQTAEGTTMSNHDFHVFEQPAEDKELLDALRIMTTGDINEATTLPLPTIAQWQNCTEQEGDLKLIKEALTNGTKLNKAALVEKGYHAEWAAHRLELEKGIIYRYDAGKRLSLRHMRAKVVPSKLRSHVFSAMHSSPLSGHNGYHKTYWKTAARYYWPGMARDIKILTHGCGHCNVTNIASHEEQQLLRNFESDAPFDVMVMDVWHPGKQAQVSQGSTSHVLIALDLMTSFAMAAFIDRLDSATVATAAFTHFFAPFGLPKLVIIDAGSEFAASMIAMCNTLGVQHYTVSRGNHKAILVERFNRYMNKVQKIHAADCQSFQDFQLGTLFAIYGWNAAPVDGTNIVRSVAAIGREFPFPIDIEQQGTATREHSSQADQTERHMDTTFPLFMQQREMLGVLTEDRRSYHRELKNNNKKPATFDVGDLVIRKVQIQTNDSQGPAKSRISARGPYRIIGSPQQGTYHLRKLPATEGNGRRGIIIKESGARLERLPSTLVIHKSTEGADNRLASLNHARINNPLESILGLHEFGQYKAAPKTANFAFEKIADLWTRPELESDEEEEETAYTEIHTAQEGITPAEQPNIPEPAPAANDEIPTTGISDKQPATTTVHRGGRSSRPTRTRKRPKKYQGGATTTKKTLSPHQRAAATLYEAIKTSSDKLFFIQHINATTVRPKWYLVQARLNATDPDDAKQEGYYQVRFQIRHHLDSNTRPLQNCRYWPEIHEVRTNGTLGKIVPIRPGRAEATLKAQPHKLRAYDQTINLLKMKLAGPFNFGEAKWHDNEAFRIPTEHWAELHTNSKKHNISTDNTSKVIPLR